MLAADFIEVPTVVALGVVGGILVASVVLSLVFPKKHAVA
jgi:hypothetical protein